MVIKTRFLSLLDCFSQCLEPRFNSNHVCLLIYIYIYSLARVIGTNFTLHVFFITMQLHWLHWNYSCFTPLDLKSESSPMELLTTVWTTYVSQYCLIGPFIPVPGEVHTYLLESKYVNKPPSLPVPPSLHFSSHRHPFFINCIVGQIIGKARKIINFFFSKTITLYTNLTQTMLNEHVCHSIFPHWRSYSMLLISLLPKYI